MTCFFFIEFCMKINVTYRFGQPCTFPWILFNGNKPNDHMVKYMYNKEKLCTHRVNTLSRMRFSFKRLNENMLFRITGNDFLKIVRTSYYYTCNLY